VDSPTWSLLQQVRTPELGRYYNFIKRL